MIRSAGGRLARNTAGSALMSLPPVMHRAAGILSGVGIDYPDAPRAADVTLGDGTRLYEALRSGRHVLIAENQTLPAYEGRLRITPPKTRPAHDGRSRIAAPGTSSGQAALIRPDGYVAWQGPAADTPAAARRFLGPAS